MEIKNILVAGNYYEEFKLHLIDHQSKEFRFISPANITAADLQWADTYVGSRPCMNFNLSHLKWVHSFNAGVNNYLELNGWIENNVLLTRTVCSFGEKISEYCLSYILRDLQKHQEFERKQHQKQWKPETPKMIKDHTFVILGTGEIGQKVAKMFNSFGATVYGVSRSGQHKDYFSEVVDHTSSNSVVSRADWIISTLPLTQDTYKIFNHQFFASMNQSVFINVGRGATVDELALIKALDSGRIRYAVLDVLSQEPLPEDSVLWERKDVLITPHISAVTDINEAVECFFETLHKIENNGILHNMVDVMKGY
ncbi:phosphoglycerate dehydrogenase-like enzyme [Bacillus mesophilus]|uniref:D-2-hydroxyacid dehydrogenase n=1 Tax=Bacillus mesophilus TaxID=1808955 RepID=A0A6M0Q9R7_9BACI|nr:D-2-hydroxyacid dehydrogenase [Bacillus mesophilus]MBM7662180.1 phosphoglycerate dehydrogenase-like enzyme [Bacillus mesophilus]NEY72469.1 D-2-hydroxyacid dehydrogenase [Bacillus mesophilus]